MEENMQSTKNEKPKDEKLLDHEYDGIHELDNFMPRWWVWGFYFTILFSIVYTVYYHFTGDRSSQAEYLAEMKGAPAKNVLVSSNLDDKEIVFKKDKTTIKAGEALFLEQACVGCHGPALNGLVGPNLTDSYWIHGCTPKELVKNISTGFPDKGMVPYGNGKELSLEKLIQLASYIASKQGSKPANPKPIDASREKKCMLK